MDDLLERIRDSGWRLTAQRRVIVEALQGEHVHLTADEVLATARAALPELGQATVYATLNEMVDRGLLAEIATGPGPRRFDPNVAVDHHHLTCRRCGAIRDVQLRRPRPVELADGDDAGYLIESTDIVVRGLCPSCQP